MTDLSRFDPNSVGNPNNNIFGLPFKEEDAELILLPIPWEVTVSYGVGTARSAEHIFKASLQVDLFDPDMPNAWRRGFFMCKADKKMMLKSDYLRKEAELYMDYISKDADVCDNKFMSKGLKEINEGSQMMNDWVYERTSDLLKKNKLVGLIGGEHSITLGFTKALAEKHGDFSILQIDAHCDLRKGYEGFTYSHASVMYNVLNEVPQVKRLLQVSVRDYCEEEWNYISANNERVKIYFDKDIKERFFEGTTWKQLSEEMINQLPEKVYLSFDIDGLDPKLCPNTGTPVLGGLQIEQVLYLIKKLIESGRKLIGFDLVEVGNGDNGLDANVGARVLWRLCNLMMKSNS